MSRRIVIGLTVMALAATAIPAEADQASLRFPSSAFPLGTGMAPVKKQRSVVPGIDLFNVTHGKSTQGWTVSVMMPNGHDAGSLATAQTQAAAAEAAGFAPGVVQVIQPAAADALLRSDTWSGSDCGRSSSAPRPMRW